jgi:hypothetical protein
MERGPPDVAFSTNVKTVPVSTIPLLPVAMIFPLNKVRTDPADCVMVAAVNACVETVPALLTVKAERAVLVPAFALKVKLPDPRVQVIEPGPLSVLKSWIALLFEEVFIVARDEEGIETEPWNETALPAVRVP